MYPTVLCIESRILNNPGLIGMHGSIKSDKSWLKIFNNANKARQYILESGNSHEVWVLGSDEVDSINLAAAIKKDRSDCIVCLIAFDLTGSLQSRAKAAKIDSVLNLDAFLERYSAKKCQINFENNNKFLNTEYNNNIIVNGFKNKDLDNSQDILKSSQSDSLTLTSNKLYNNSHKNKFLEIPASSKIQPSNKNAFILPVVSASGGSGKSSVSAISSILCSASGYKTLIFDADTQFGDLAFMFGLDHPITIDKLIENPKNFEKLAPKDSMPALLSGFSKPELAEKYSGYLEDLLNTLKTYYDVIVINTGGFWEETHAILLEKSSKTLFLIDQRPTSINSTKRAINLCGRCGIATSSLIFAVNKCRKNALYTSVDIACALQGANVAEIKDGGIEVDECFANGQPDLLLQYKNDFVLSVWDILESILPKSESALQIQENMNFSNKKTKKTSRFFRKNRA